MTSFGGLDFGNALCKTATVAATGDPVIVPNSRGEQSTPTAVFVPESGEPLLGQDALEQGQVHPERLVSDIKRNLASPDSVLGNDCVFTRVDAGTLLIAYQKRMLEQAYGVAVTDCAATCPANFHDDEKQALLECYKRNGLEVLTLVPEPTSAAIAYARRRSHNDRTIAVYDFGGGTFDASVVRTDGDQITVLATEGVSKLGGRDLNDRLQEYLLDRFKSKFKQVPSPDEDPFFYYDLKQRVEQAKISLGAQEQVPVVLAHGGDQLVVEVTQADFHEAIDPLVKKSIETLDQAVAAAGLPLEKIDHLIMVGGTSRMPYIQNAVAEHTGIAPRTDIDPEKAVAFGAAIACLVELTRQGKTAVVRGHVIPAPDLFVREVTAHAVGCCVVDKAKGDRCLRHSALIPKNTPIPCRKTDRFLLEHDDQAKAQIEILQGEPGAERDACLLIGELVLDDLPPEDKATDRIQIEYVIDGNGMVTATATDLVSGKQQTVSVDYKKGVKPKDRPRVA